jgi:hypothetical protein
MTVSLLSMPSGADIRSAKSALNFQNAGRSGLVNVTDAKGFGAKLLGAEWDKDDYI